MQEHPKLIMNIHDQKLPAIGCGYYYTITTYCTAHTAFKTTEAMKLWLNQTGLKIGKRMWGRAVRLTGTYFTDMVMLNNARFFAEYGQLEAIRWLSNGDYIIGFLERRENGNIIHYQNPNTNRLVLDYRKAENALAQGLKVF